MQCDNPTLRGWGRPNLVCNVKDKTSESKWKHVITKQADSTLNHKLDFRVTTLIYPTIPLKIHQIHNCIFIRFRLNWSHLCLMEHKLFFLDENKLNVAHMEGRKQ